MSTVMIVDDSKTSRTMLRNILTEHGYEVVAEAENGQEGYEKYCEFNPDFVTLDITMPVMDGIENACKNKGIRRQCQGYNGNSGRAEGQNA